MKKLFLLLVLVLVPVIASAQTWHTANQATLSWDAVAPIAVGDVMKYQVYSKVGATGTPAVVGAEITTTQLTVSFSVEGRYYMCVQALRYPTGETEALKSAIVCSDVAANVQGGIPFGIKYFVSPGAPANMRRVP